MLELAAVERHLLQAKGKVLTEEEKALSEENRVFHGYDSIGIPTGKIFKLQN